MSKSSGKIKTISQLEDEGISPLAYRYFTYTAHYRKSLSWSDEAIGSAVASYRKLKNVVLSLVDDGKMNKKYLKEFDAKINDDLDMPGALAVLWNLVRNEKAEGKVGVIRKMDEVFGLKLLETEDLEIPLDIKKIAEERAKARDEKDWEKSDELRDKLAGMGWKIKDTKEGFELDKNGN